MDLDIGAVVSASRVNHFRMTERNKPPVRFLVGDLRMLPFREGGADVVLCSEVL
jgi:ubiquinone/menaquinone biosynthesis C-methylase UbiE